MPCPSPSSTMCSPPRRCAAPAPIRRWCPSSSWTRRPCCRPPMSSRCPRLESHPPKRPKLVAWWLHLRRCSTSDAAGAVVPRRARTRPPTVLCLVHRARSSQASRRLPPRSAAPMRLRASNSSRSPPRRAAMSRQVTSRRRTRDTHSSAVRPRWARRRSAARSSVAATSSATRSTAWKTWTWTCSWTRRRSTRTRWRRRSTTAVRRCGAMRVDPRRRARSASERPNVRWRSATMRTSSRRAAPRRRTRNRSASWSVITSSTTPRTCPASWPRCARSRARRPAPRRVTQNCWK
mmetsp:Transcript_28447/g.71447  ORF Transcript_28447/g.71447 Transcript_28447/m.71447 type:complete len:292 (+) Transcript_28447:1885-2760(+)